MSAFLAPADIRQLTGSSTLDAQRSWLDAHGIPYRVGDAGRRRWLIVAQLHVHDWLAGRTVTPSKRPNIAAAR